MRWITQPYNQLQIGVLNILICLSIFTEPTNVNFISVCNREKLRYVDLFFLRNTHTAVYVWLYSSHPRSQTTTVRSFDSIAMQRGMAHTNTHTQKEHTRHSIRTAVSQSTVLHISIHYLAVISYMVAVHNFIPKQRANVIGCVIIKRAVFKIHVHCVAKRQIFISLDIGD